MRRALVLCGALLFAGGCKGEAAVQPQLAPVPPPKAAVEETSVQRIDGVTRVLPSDTMGEFMIIRPVSGGGQKMHWLVCLKYANCATFVSDVPQDVGIWLEATPAGCNRKNDEDFMCASKLVFHLHSIKEVGGP